MKILIAALITLMAVLPAAAQDSNDEQQIRALLDEFMAAAGTGDRKVFDRFWAEDLMYTRSTGETTNKPEIMKSLPEKPMPAEQAATRYRAEDVKVQIYGDTALVTFRLVQQTRDGAHLKDTAQFRNSATFLKRNGRWQAALWQATRIPEKKPEEETTEKK